VSETPAERLFLERLQFLDSVNEAVNGTTNIAETMESVAKACTSDLADWCVLWLLAEPGHDLDRGDPKVATAHRDPSQVGHLSALVESIASHDREVGILKAGGPRLVHLQDPGVDLFEEIGALSSEQLRELKATSICSAPLNKRGRRLGTLELGRSAGREPFDGTDLQTLSATAARLASTFENLRLMGRQREIATALQRGLLPREIPAPDGGQVAVRYWAAREGGEVGGDFYDFFEVRPGTWAAVVGDVCGKGPDAAAITSLARHSIRMSAWHQDTPEQVLAWLNHAMFPVQDAIFCTAAYVEMTVRESSSFDVRVVSGGHPLPILVRRDGSVTQVGQPGTLLGVFPDATSDEVRLTLGPGDLLMLYTDGITDERPPRDLTPEALADLVRAVRIDNEGVEDFADVLAGELNNISPIEDREDDIALLAIAVDQPA